MNDLAYLNTGLIALLLLVFYSCKAQPSANQKGSHTQANRLIDESSPYLLQHAYNPVDWYPWGDEAWNKAKTEEKLVVISVGYAACHWCHVMEHESFEDSTVAAQMNDLYVAIKVDREERPDVDDIYMNACGLMSQNCGWPLNVIALPDGRPIFAGTYFPKNQWLDVLERVQQVYQNDPDKIEQIADRAENAIQSLQAVAAGNPEAEYHMEDLTTLTQTFLSSQDLKKGGREGAPKFPMPSNYDYLLHYASISGDEQALQAVYTTLDQMALGGIYDHLGGGFSRYSTDAYWKVPHFEKMLYDNGQLVSLYSKAYQQTHNPLYQQIVEETLEYIAREMTSEEGGFYSSLDADSEGEEGKFYVWKQAEINQLLGDDAAWFSQYYEVTEKGNWEHGNNILHRKKPTETFAQELGIKPEPFLTQLQQAKSQLFEARAQRVRPGLDDKQITAWNALMLQGYVDAYRALGQSEYLEAALNNARFIEKYCLQKDFRLNRIYKDGTSSINGFLDDYALTATAFVGLYQATFDEKWLFLAQDLVNYTFEHFFDPQTQTFFYTSDLDDPLLTRQRELGDDVIPGSNSTMARLLFTLGTYLYQPKWIDAAKLMLSKVEETVNRQPSYHANWAHLMLQLVHPPYEVAIVGEEYEARRKELDQYYLPQVLLLGGKTEGKLDLLKNKRVNGQTTIYVCQDKICKLPVTDTEAALKLMK